MQQRHAKIAIIGAGSAGLSAWHAANKHTEDIVLIEAGAYGTTCARVGCMPSKLLIAAANAAHNARKAEMFGVTVNEVVIDGQAVMARVRHERDRFVDGVLASVKKIPESQHMRGHARFIDPHTLMIDDHTELTAEAIIIATGSRPTWPSLLEAAGDRLIVNDDVFDWEMLPESVAIVGPGVIGMELGQALSRLGVRTRTFGVGGAVGPFQSEALRQLADETFNEELYLDPDATLDKPKRRENGVDVTFKQRDSGQKMTETFDYVLAATGRQPNVDRLDIEKAELTLDNRGVPEFNRFSLQCLSAQGTPSHIFIVGDANQSVPLLHEAITEGKIAGRNAANPYNVQVGQRNVPLAIVFTEPQMATVGESRASLEKQYGGCDCIAEGGVSLADQGRARVMGENQGYFALYAAHGSGQFLGAELFGPRVEHIAHLLAWSLEQKLTVSQMLAMPFYHPVLEEGLRTGLRELQANLQQGPGILERCMECGPGD
ncbi:dihydrolipoyl dehydrogenase [Halovibrio sp. HP20-50]|uniref:dihydrolipoyl dehydrogenase n=1 Tax=Halovibrio sp. HP20-59 TaxID=3080275 RepID=UPI00294AB29D|nr:dihydrolipoyl dehydrogenase [Halovibrio sp. HP20-59]MEA2117522.1 dihydrolipoyl dehydrogenase [Halovibrio sp. HP20-59]